LISIFFGPLKKQNSCNKHFYLFVLIGY